jgi:hypothetical protein
MGSDRMSVTLLSSLRAGDEVRGEVVGCAVCSVLYVTARCARFCSDACRKRASRKREKGTYGQATQADDR